MNIRINSLIEILKNPYSERGYEQLANYCETNNRKNEAEAIKELISNAYDTSTYEK